MSVAILFSCLVLVQQTPKISFELRGVRLKNAAPLLARTFGIDSLQIGPTIMNDVLLIRTKDVDPELLKANIAKVLNASWIKRTEGWWLTQTDEQKLSERKIFDKERFRVFSEIVEKAKKATANSRPFDEVECKRLIKEVQAIVPAKGVRFDFGIYEKFNKIDRQSPLNRLMWRAMQRITPAQWMNLSDDKPRVVFCSNPTMMQKPFPFRMDDILGQAIQEQNQWSATYDQSALKKNAEDSQFQELGDQSGLFGQTESFRAKDFSLFTMTFDLNLRRIEFKFYNEKGHLTFSTIANPYDDYVESKVEEVEEKKPIKLVGEADEFLKLVSTSNGQGRSFNSRKQISPLLLEKMLHPESVDPLSIAAPEIYFKGIDTPNMVLILSDEQITYDNPEPPEGVEYVVDQGWCLSKVFNPIELRRHLPDREQLGKVMRYLEGIRRPLTLEEQGTFALSLPYGETAQYEFNSHLSPIQPKEIETYNSDGALRIFGSLNGGQRAQALKGGISISKLSDVARFEIFRSLYFNGEGECSTSLTFPDEQELTPAQQLLFEQIEAQTYGGVLRESTFSVPNGLTNNMVLTFEESSEDVLQCSQKSRPKEDSYGSNGIEATPESIASYLYIAKHPEKFGAEMTDRMVINENEIYLAKKRGIAMKLRINNFLTIDWSLSHTQISDPKQYSVKTLPKPILDAINLALIDVEKAYKDWDFTKMRGGRSDRRGPPPPPTK
jgi:hypothetical protein